MTNTSKTRAGSRQAKAFEAAKRQREAARLIAAQQRSSRIKRAERVAVASQTSDGLAPAWRARLHDAANRAATDPRAVKALAAAELDKRVRDVRAHHGMQAAVKPIGEAVPLAPEELPPSMADLRRAKAAAQTDEVRAKKRK